MRTFCVMRLGAAILVLVSSAAMAQTVSRPFEGLTALTDSSSHAREIAEECIRNNAYGLPTRGLPVMVYCHQLGNTEALKLQRRAKSGPRYSANPGGLH